MAKFNEFVNFLIPAGWHMLANFPAIKFFRLSRFEGIEWEVIFDESVRYLLDNGDQKDWNKGGGISFRLFSNNKESVQWAWRYNPDNDEVELTAYSNSKKFPKGRFIGKFGGDVMHRLSIGEKAIIRIYRSTQKPDVFYIRIARVHPENFEQVGHIARKAWKWARLFGMWFGGNRFAPDNITGKIKTTIL